jgi:hypothetical protein
VISLVRIRLQSYRKLPEFHVAVCGNRWRATVPGHEGGGAGTVLFPNHPWTPRLDQGVRWLADPNSDFLFGRRIQTGGGPCIGCLDLCAEGGKFNYTLANAQISQVMTATGAAVRSVGSTGVPASATWAGPIGTLLFV